MPQEVLLPIMPRREEIRPGMVLLRGFAQPAPILAAIAAVASAAPFRRMSTPGGQPMSVAMTNCGALGWVSDRTGYRYDARDPQSGTAWPEMPMLFAALAADAAQRAGFPGFSPDACLVNRYEPGARMGAHQDRDECDLNQPIVSVSLGLPATFFVLPGTARAGAARSVPLESGDVIVFGGPARLAYHGVRPVKAEADPIAGAYRYNLTFRRAA